MPFDKFNDQEWCGPNHPLARLVAQLLNSQAGDGLTKQLRTSEAFEAGLVAFAQRYNDALLRHRWAGLKALAQFIMTGDESHISTAVSSFDLALGGEVRGKKYDRPTGASAALNKFGPHRQADTPRSIAALARDQWTPGSFIVHDFLTERCIGPIKCIAETTPILAAGELAGTNDFGAVLSLVVQALPGPFGLITPDFWAMGLSAFGVSNSDARNFLSIMHDAFRETLVKDRPVRLRWHLNLRSGTFPRVLQGRSAEVAGACCVRALMDQNARNPGPLLDKDVAVTARLRESGGEEFKDRPLEHVNEKTLNAKFDVGVNAGLTAVLVCNGQAPPEKKIHTKKGLAGSEDRSVLIQRVPTLGDAYESLLITSAAIAEYKKVKVEDDWKKHWKEEPTPPEFADASQKDR